MKLSVITIVLNDKEGLERTFKSVRNQSSTEFEFIVIDGGSTDGTLNLIKYNIDIITKFISEKDSGISDAFNKGINNSLGCYSLMMNSGDIFHSDDSVSKLLLSGVLQDGNDIVCGSIISNAADGVVVPEIITNYELIPHQGAFIGKNVYRTLGVYSVGFVIRMDLEFFLRAKKNNIKIISVKQIISKYSAGGKSNYIGNRSLFYREAIAAYILHGYNFRLSNLIRFIFWTFYLWISKKSKRTL